MTPSSLTSVHFRVCWSLLYAGFAAADCESRRAVPPLFSSMKVSAMKLLTTEGLTGAYVRDQRTTPDVVRISNVSSMAAREGRYQVETTSRLVDAGNGQDKQRGMAKAAYEYEYS